MGLRFQHSPNLIMELEPLNVLLISNDGRLARDVAEMLRESAKVSTVPTLEAGRAELTANACQAVLFEHSPAGGDSPSQVARLTVQFPRLPVVVIGPPDDGTFGAEIIRAGAQDYLVRDGMNPGALRRALDFAMERHRKRLALADEKDNYYNFFNHLVEGTFRTTPDGHYLLANVALARIYGYDSPGELMASIQDIASQMYVEPGRREEFVRLMQEHDTLTGFESRIYRKDGGIIWISENCRAVRGADGRLLYYEGTVEDITERKHSEEEIRRTTTELSRSREDLRRKNLTMEENLRTAREIQLTMLPQQCPVFPSGVPPEQSAFQFLHRYQAAESVSGDFFSVTALSDAEAAVFICDVTGHGIRAALVTAMIRALVEELKPLAREPGNFLRKLNSDLCSILKSTGSPMLTTAFYLVADWRAGKMRFANAGHPKPLLVHRATGRIEPLANASGHGEPALGLFDNPSYQATEIAIIPGDFVMLFTDGLYEVQGQNEVFYSQERLMLDTQNLLHKPAAQMFDELMEAIRTFSVNNEFDDDVCLVGMEFVKKQGGQA